MIKTLRPDSIVTSIPAHATTTSTVSPNVLFMDSVANAHESLSKLKALLKDLKSKEQRKLHIVTVVVVAVLIFLMLGFTVWQR